MVASLSWCPGSSGSVWKTFATPTQKTSATPPEEEPGEPRPKEEEEKQVGPSGGLYWTDLKIHCPTKVVHK